jgi:lysophospholipase L1-like esterase
MSGRRRLDLPNGGRALAAALLLAVLAAPAARAADDPCQGQALCDAQALTPFLKALQGLETGQRTRPVHILQIGDSHTAADNIAGPLRARLQARFGEAGRGAMPPGRPYPSYAPQQMEVEQSDGWRLEASFVPPEPAHVRPGKAGAPILAPGPFGLSGWRLAATRSGASIKLKADPEARFDRVTACALAGPEAGELRIVTDEGEKRMPLAAIVTQPVCRTFALSEPVDRLAFIARGGRVRLLSFATWRERPGVVLSNLGVVGTQLGDFAARDDGVMRAELQAYQPDLIILAYGTNDGFEDHVDAGVYEAVARAQIERLRRLAPGVPVLVVGPPDADTVRRDIPRDGVHNVGFACAPLSPAEITDFDALTAARSPELARWFPPPGLAVVREAERRAAEQEDVAFWDWSARMGGPCSAHRLSQEDPRLVRGDHIHFTSDGGRMVADLLMSDLLAAYRQIGGGG